MSNMPSEMMRAAELLEVRLDFLQSHTESIAPEEWAGLQPNIRIFIPDWLIELHASYRLSGCVMKTVEPVENLTLYFRFCVPNTLSSISDFVTDTVPPQQLTPWEWAKLRGYSGTPC